MFFLVLTQSHLVLKKQGLSGMRTYVNYPEWLDQIDDKSVTCARVKSVGNIVEQDPS